MRKTTDSDGEIRGWRPSARPLRYAGFSGDYRRHAMSVGTAFVQARAQELRQFHANAAGVAS